MEPRTPDNTDVNSSQVAGNHARRVSWALISFAYLILFSIFIVFARDLFVGKSVLVSLGDPSYARGLITYLYAIGTIGIIVIVVMAARLRSIGDIQVDKAKDFVAILVGVFGTIIGFYFGTGPAPQRT